MVSDGLDDVLAYGFTVATVCWFPLSVLCLAGLVFMLLGHRVAIPGQMLINRAFFYIMMTTLTFSVAFVGLGLYARSIDRSYGLVVYLVGCMMLAPAALSLVALLLRRCSPFPIQRAPRTLL
jgi:hypothetical protein